MAAKFDWGAYFQPTPKLFRQIGDTLLGASAFVATTTIIQGSEGMAIAAVWVGVAGKMITNFFKEPTTGE